MQRIKIKRLRLAVLLSLGCLAVLATVSALAFVPSCEEELAQAYPSAFVADLGACDEAAPIDGVEVADFGKFTQRLNGTWELNLRTHQGLPSDLAGQKSRLHIDLQAEGTQVTGTAMLIDEGRDLATPASVGGFWRIRLEQPEKSAIVMKMHLGSPDFFAQAGLEPASELRFVESKDIFVASAAAKQDGSSPAWDRVVWMENSVTYISCAKGTIERFAKVSEEKPKVDGVSLEEYWQKVEREFEKGRKVAQLGATANVSLASR